MTASNGPATPASAAATASATGPATASASAPVARTALGHLKVLDLSRILAGPWATQNLADMGAEVIKVERPGVGDDTRAWGPPFLKDAQGQDTRESSYFLSTNRGKKSITLDIATPEGQAIVRDLVKDADVLVENYKVGTLIRYGLDHASLRAINPRLVYCSVTGYGQDGPLALLPGYDYVFQGMGGLMSMTGVPDGQPGAAPMKSGLAIGDLMTGMYATTAILAAIEHRHISGEGQYIDMALLDCMVSINSYMAVNYLLSGTVPRRLGNAHANMVPYQVFHCREGDIIIAIGNDGQYRAFCQVVGCPELAQDERYATAPQRNRHREILLPLLAKAMLARSMTEWVPLLEARNVPCGPILNMDQVFENKQVQYRQMKIDLPHAIGTTAPGVASPIRLSDTPVRHHRAAPTLGEHNRDVLQGRLGLSDAQMAELQAKGVV